MSIKILILVDNDSRAPLVRHLVERGYKVERVADPRAAWKAVQRTPYDLLLIDVGQEIKTETDAESDPTGAPEDILALVKRVRGVHPKLPQIILCDSDQRSWASKALAAGAHDLIPEPGEHLSELEYRITRTLEWSKLTRDAERYPALIHNFPGIILWGDEQFVVQIIHGRVQEITGYPPQAFTERGMNLGDLIYPPDLSQIFPQARQSLKQGEPTTIEFRLQRPDGTLRWVECTLMPSQGPEKEIQSISGVILDVAERKEAEMALSQRLQEQETLFAISQLVSSSLRIEEVTHLVAEQMARLVDAASCAISDWDPETDTLTARAKYVRPQHVDPDDPVNDLGQPYPLSEYPVTAAALRQNKTFVVYRDDPQADPQERRLLELYQWYGVAGIPLVIQDRVIGLAKIYLAEEGKSFNRHDLRLLQTLANQIASAIDNARLFAAIQANEAALRDLSLRLIEVQEKERRYIARELHDELGQLLTATKINIDLVHRKLCHQTDPAGAVLKICSRLEEAGALTDKVLTNVRAMTVELRPTLLDDLGIVPTLRWYLGRFEIRTGILARLEAQELPRRLQPEIETTIYRIVQEALTNVARHARASQVLVQLTCSSDTVHALVQDDGRGFDVQAWSRRQDKPSLGLTGIQERAMLLGGRTEIASQPGQGTQISLALPARFTLEEEE